MATAVVDGIEIYYETYGSGPPLLMFAPGGFDSTIEKWRVASAWTGIDALARLGSEHQVIAYDRREAGQSGGRVERLTWTAYAREGKQLLDRSAIHVTLYDVFQKVRRPLFSAVIDTQPDWINTQSA